MTIVDSTECFNIVKYFVTYRYCIFICKSRCFYFEKVGTRQRISFSLNILSNPIFSIPLFVKYRLRKVFGKRVPTARIKRGKWVYQ